MKNKIKESLTKTEFERLANRQPDFDGKWVYELIQNYLDSDTENLYPKFPLYSQKRFFLSYEDALDSMRQSEKEDLYCSLIVQRPADGREHGSGAVWLFGKDNELLDYTVTHDNSGDLRDCFFGRSEASQRFQPGDIVEVVSEGESVLAVLAGNAPDIEWCWKRYEASLRSGEPYNLDDTDELVTILDGPSYSYHRHVSPVCLMSPRFPIPEDIEKDMKTWFERAKNEPAEELQSRCHSRARINKVNIYGDTYGSFGEIVIMIDYTNKNERPAIQLTDNYGLNVSLYIDSPDYADRRSFNGRLSDSQLKALQDFLEYEEQGKSRWWYILRDWNRENENLPIPMETPIPNYTNLING